VFYPGVYSMDKPVEDGFDVQEKPLQDPGCRDGVTTWLARAARGIFLVWGSNQEPNISLRNSRDAFNSSSSELFEARIFKASQVIISMTGGVSRAGFDSSAAY
jgi:hypothetical protein